MSSAGNLAAWLIEGALATGAGPRRALREGDRGWTFDELASHVTRLSAALRVLKLSRGERVLILMSDTIEAAASILAVTHSGAVAVTISVLSTSDDVQEYVLHAGAVLAIVDGTHEKVLDAIRLETPDLRDVICVGSTLPGTHDWLQLVEGSQPTTPIPMSENDVSLLL